MNSGLLLVISPSRSPNGKAGYIQRLEVVLNQPNHIRIDGVRCGESQGFRSMPIAANCSGVYEVRYLNICVKHVKARLSGAFLLALFGIDAVTYSPFISSKHLEGSDLVPRLRYNCAQWVRAYLDAAT